MESNYYSLEVPTAQIRLFELLEPTISGDLSGRLKLVTIEQAPSFVSISHVWGRSQAGRTMRIKSDREDRTVPISCNLESLLVGLLCHTPTTLPDLWSNGSRLPMWIDMICVNQADEDEKASQIPLMKQIYSRAASVLVWIHEYDGYLQYAFCYVRHLLEDEHKDEAVSARFDPLGWSSIKRLLQCEWFHRRWVVQEAAVANRTLILCGSQSLLFDDLLHGIDLAVAILLARPTDSKLLYFATAGHVRPLRVLQNLQIFLKDSQYPRLLWLLENLRNTRATLAHDQIYGLLGACSPREAGGNPIRYHHSAEQAYQLCVNTHAHLYNDLDFLGLCTSVQRDTLCDALSDNGSCRPFEGPSWVPNWHSKSLRRCLGVGSLTHGQAYFNASATIPVAFEFDQTKLVVSGKMIDRIQVLGDFYGTDKDAESSNPDAIIYQKYFDFWVSVADRPSPYAKGGTWATAFSRTLSLLGVYLDPVPSPDEVPELFMRWCNNGHLGKELERRGLNSVGRNTSSNRRAFRRMKRLASWRPFITEKGYIGLAREGCQVKDQIWIIGGCSVPLLLSAARQHEVLGEVFLDGFMFGESEEINGTSVDKVILI
ncbi:hypothetical protein E8E14_007362 [Neopestalotiopsis sp. 37M]|nr:hypothetical protein E8E14_007362 [Neopestalotiopsis sp. 37M]